MFSVEVKNAWNLTSTLNHDVVGYDLEVGIDIRQSARGVTEESYPRPIGTVRAGMSSYQSH
jgi:hypothetical protein